MGFYVTENGLHPYITENGLRPYVTENTGTSPSGYLASVVGVIPASLNMLPWTAFGQATDFTNSEYITSNASITTGVLGPDGSSLAQKLVENSATSTHFVQDNNLQTNTQNPIRYRMACIAQAVERTRIVMFWQNFEQPNTIASVGFDLAGGHVGYDNVAGSDAAIDAYSMTSLGSGWWLCQFDVHFTGAPPAGGVSLVWLPQINLDNGSGTAARSISYAGNGTDGVNLFWFSMLPTAAWSITTEVFSDDFTSLSTIDVNDTRAPGFNWYVHNLMPNSFMPTFGWTTNPPSAPTPSANLSISSPSVLKIYNPNNHQTGFTSQIWSVCDNGLGGYTGQAFTGPLVFDGYFSWDGTIAGNSPNWSGNPAFWSAAVEAMTGNMGGATHFTEWDVVEGAPVTAGDFSTSFTLHDWSNPASPVDAALAHNNGIKQLPGVFNRYSSIFLNTAATGTSWGLYLTFFNGEFQAFGDRAYSASTIPQPDQGRPSGTLFAGDTQTYPILIDTAENTTVNPGGGWAMYIDWVRIYR
jgi:hypothetical protein